MDGILEEDGTSGAGRRKTLRQSPRLLRAEQPHDTRKVHPGGTPEVRPAGSGTEGTVCCTDVAPYPQLLSSDTSDNTMD